VKKFIGDLSKQDAALLESYAENSRSVLEFGVGGSTQIIAQSILPGTGFISLDTDDRWIEKTRVNLRRLGVEDRCRMLRYGDFPVTGEFDLIFNDGCESLRREFALKSFPLLAVGGALLFHDTRRLPYVQNVMAVVETFFEEIEHVYLNIASSNITVVRKKAKQPYVSWNAVEQKLSWQVGYGEVPEEFWKG
jgi:predicted O-methyltransferase YrrM